MFPGLTGAQPQLQPCLSLCTHGSQPAGLLRPQERAAISSSQEILLTQGSKLYLYISCLDRWVQHKHSATWEAQG